MVKSIDEIMNIVDNNNPFRYGLLYGQGGLGYKPSPYNMVGGGGDYYDSDSDEEYNKKEDNKREDDKKEEYNKREDNKKQDYIKEDYIKEDYIKEYDKKEDDKKEDYKKQADKKEADKKEDDELGIFTLNDKFTISGKDMVKNIDEILPTLNDITITHFYLDNMKQIILRNSKTNNITLTKYVNKLDTETLEKIIKEKQEINPNEIFTKKKPRKLKLNNTELNELLELENKKIEKKIKEKQEINPNELLEKEELFTKKIPRKLKLINTDLKKYKYKPFYDDFNYKKDNNIKDNIIEHKILSDIKNDKFIHKDEYIIKPKKNDNIYEKKSEIIKVKVKPIIKKKEKKKNIIKSINKRNILKKINGYGINNFSSDEVNEYKKILKHLLSHILDNKEKSDIRDVKQAKELIDKINSKKKVYRK